MQIRIKGFTQIVQGDFLLFHVSLNFSEHTHFKQPVLFFLFIEMHLGLAQCPAPCQRFGGEVELHPLQVEAQPRANGFDETLLQGL